MYNIVKIQNTLPHRYPFLLVDKVSTLQDENYIEGYKNVSISDPVFQGHFPNHPIYPGVFILEGLAQIGGILIVESIKAKNSPEFMNNKIVYFMSIDKAKFRVPVLPGDKLVYKVTTIQQRNSVWSFKAQAFVDDKLVAEAFLKSMIVDKKN